MLSTRWQTGRHLGLGLLALAVVAFHAPMAEAGRTGGSRSSFGGSRSSGSSFGGSSRSSGGSFGGSSRSSGSSSFGSSSSSRPSSGGSFGSSSSSKPSSGGSFGSSSPSRSGSGSFGSSSSSSSRPSTGGSFGSSTRPSTGGSFGTGGSTTTSRTGSFGSPSFARSSSSIPSYYSSRSPLRSSALPYAAGGFAAGALTAHYYGGWSDYSLGWARPHWYYYTPFHPAFYYSRPVYVDGGLYPGSFSLGRLIFGGIVLFFIAAVVIGMLKGRGPKYTTYDG